MNQKILLIDDSAILRRIAANVLGARFGRSEVITATRANEGFARACASGVDLILVDNQIAGPTDAELCRRLLTEPRTAGIPVVLLLGRGAQPTASDTLPDNIVSTLAKPFTPEQLVSTIGTIFEASKADPSFRAIRECLHPDRRSAAVDASAVTSTEPGSGMEEVLADAYRPIAGLTHDDNPAPTDGNQTDFISVLAALRTVAEQGLTGVLRVSPAGQFPIEIYTEGGRVVVVSTRDADQYSLGAADVLPAKVSPATLESAVAEQSRSGVPFFLPLGTRGLLSKAAAVTLLHRFGQRYFARLWPMRHTRLSIGFEALEALPGFALRLEPRREPIEDWLLGTLRHLSSEDIVPLMRHEGSVGTASYQRGGTAAIQTLKLTESEREFAKAVNGRDDLPSIAKKLGLSGEDAFLLLYRFRCLEIMDYRSAPSAFVVTPRTNVRRALPLPR